MALAGSVTPEEEVRLADLRDLGILDTEPEQAYDDLTLLASTIVATPMALITLLDARRQWFKSRVGVKERETPREVAFCDVAIRTPHDLLVVEDATEDPRFRDNPRVVGDPNVRFYAGAPLVTAAGNALGTICVIDTVPRPGLTEAQADALRTLSRLAVALMELRRMVETDPLTGLGTRRQGYRRLHDELERTRRYGTPFAAVLVDMDHFKSVNDTYGHAAGDDILREFGALLRRHLRTTDFAVRVGGEEFLIGLAQTNAEEALAAAERLRAIVEAHTWPHRAMTASFGVAAAHPGYQDHLSLLAAADAALYRAKGSGRNRVAAAPA